MKLLMCSHCGDMFNLQRHLKACRCGITKGHYIDNEQAEVNGEGYSLAIGNGSLHFAIANSLNMKDDWRDHTEGDFYKKHETAIICWARPHDGPANSHTKVNKNL